MATIPVVGQGDSEAGRPTNTTDNSSVEYQQGSVVLQGTGGAGPNNINWLNSSYSGADIKVVAHLYVDTTSQALTQLQFQINVAKKVRDGAFALQDAISYSNTSSPLSSSLNILSIFTSYCFPNGVTDNEDGEALRVLKQNLLEVFINILGNNRLQVTGDFLLSCQLLQQEQAALIPSLQAQLTKLKSQKDASSSVLTLGHLQTLSVQTHREKNAVRALGKSYVSGHTRGPRTIAGSMIFTVFDEHPLYKLIRAMDDAKLSGETGYDVGASTLIPDQLPPIDLTIIFANEYGSISRMGIYGVEFLNDGQTMSIEDLFSEQVMNFMARDVDIMTSVGMMKLSQAMRGIYDKEGQPVKASDLYYNGLDDYKKYLDRLGLRRMFKGR